MIRQDKEEVGCHYEEKNENAAPVKVPVEVELVETALRETTLRETTLRETRIGDVVAPRRAEYIHTLEAQSSVDSDVIVHNVSWRKLPLKHATRHDLISKNIHHLNFHRRDI